MKKIVAIMLVLLLTIGVGSNGCLAQSEGSSLFDLFMEGFETKLGQWTYSTPEIEQIRFMLIGHGENSFEAMAMVDGRFITFGAAIDDQWEVNQKFWPEGLKDLLDAQPLTTLNGCSARVVALSGMDDDEEIVYLGAWIGGHRVTAYQRQYSADIPVGPYVFANDLLVQLLEQADQESMTAFDFELLADEYVPEEPTQTSGNLITFENGVFGIAGRFFDCRNAQTSENVSEMFQHIANTTGCKINYSKQGYYSLLVGEKLTDSEPIYALSARAAILELPLITCGGTVAFRCGIQLLPSEFTADGNRKLFEQLASEIETLYGNPDEYWFETADEAFAMEDGLTAAELSSAWHQICESIDGSIYLKMKFGNLTITLEKQVYENGQVGYGCWILVFPHL